MKAEEQWRAEIGGGGALPEDMPVFKVTKAHLETNGRVAVRRLLTGVTAFCSSNGDASRLIEQGGVEVDGKRIDDVRAEVDLKSGMVLKAGKKNTHASSADDRAAGSNVAKIESACPVALGRAASAR